MKKTYKIGSRGNVVKQIQTALNIESDGVFGTETESAVKDFQLKHNLVVDGIVGEKTMEILLPKTENKTSVLTSSIISSFSNTTFNSKAAPKPVIEDYFLPKSQYINGVYKNDYIILHHTAGHDSPKQVVDNWAKDAAGRVATEFVIGGQRSTDGRNTYDGKIIHAFPEKNQAYHIGNCGSSYMSLHSVGIEMCNIGWVKNGKSYVNTIVRPDQIITLEEPFRGYTRWHKYSDAQLKSLYSLLLYIADRDNIDLHEGLYKWIGKEGVNAFDFHQDAYLGKCKGLISHANIRKDKFDVCPQQELIDLILSL